MHFSLLNPTGVPPSPPAWRCRLEPADLQVPVHLHGPDGPAKDMLVLQIKGGKNPGNLEALGARPFAEPPRLLEIIVVGSNQNC